MSREKKVRGNRPPSKQRGLPFGGGGPCRRLRECGACPLLPLSYAEQLEWKYDDLNAHLQRYSELSSLKVHRASPPPQGQFGYRHTVKPSVRAGSDPSSPLRVGLYQPGSHRLVDLSECLVQTSGLNELLEAIRVIAPRVGLLGYQPGDEALIDQPRLRYIVARQGLSPAVGESVDEYREALYLTLVVTALDPSVIDLLIEELRERCPSLMGVALHINRLSGNAIFDHEQSTDHRWGESVLCHLLRPLPESPPIAIQLSASSFAQVNPEVAEAAYQAVVSGLDPQPGERALDVYCGVGSIGLLLAARARERGGPLSRLYGLEETESSLRDAEQNALQLKIDEARFILGRAEEKIAALLSESSCQPHHPLVVALNPSRRGCQPEVLSAIADLKPRRIAYMSCHAKTLARDLSRLAEHGYTAETLTFFDMFPGSVHYETVTILSPR